MNKFIIAAVLSLTACGGSSNDEQTPPADQYPQPIHHHQETK